MSIPSPRSNDAFTTIGSETLIAVDSLMADVADATDAYVGILDHRREIVYANKKLLDDFEGNLRRALGHRFGELVGCRNADVAPDGCGTTAGCIECGANKAIQGVGYAPQVVEECRILRKDGEPIDLRVTVAPLRVGPDSLTLLTAVDISDTKRREILERIFFHDIMNTATGIQGLAAMIRSVPAAEQDELLDLLEASSQQLVEEIGAQRQILEIELSELDAQPQLVRSSQVLHDVAGMYESHESCAGKHIEITATEDIELLIDPVLLTRVLGNLTKNALEASEPGDEVTIECTRNEEHVEFRIHNPAAMPPSVQLQVFQRSFSTKGNGRGLGTYSSRLITRRYMNGELSFSSSPEAGTTFTASFPIGL